MSGPNSSTASKPGNLCCLKNCHGNSCYISHEDTGLHCIQRLALFSRGVTPQNTRAQINMWSGIKRGEGRGDDREGSCWSWLLYHPTWVYLENLHSDWQATEESTDSSKDKGLCSVQGSQDAQNQKGKTEVREFSSFNNKLYQYRGRIY